MPSDFELTRREFVKTAAQVSAVAMVVGGATLPAQTTGAGAGGLESQPAAKEVAMGSVFPYGAVYFRKSNPPAEDWARDHATAARVGMNTFRHWFLWGAIEVAPGKFDWADYDQMMDLAHANGLKVIIAEFTTCAPEWAFRKYASARYQGERRIGCEEARSARVRGGRISRTVSRQSGGAGRGGEISDGADRALQEPSGAAGIRPLEREHLQRRRATQDELLLRWHQGPAARVAAGALWFAGGAWARHGTDTATRRGRMWIRPRRLAGYAESLDWLEFESTMRFGC